MEKIDRAEVIISKIKNGMAVKKWRKDLAVIGLAGVLFASSASLAITTDNMEKNTAETAFNNARQSAVTAQAKSSSIYGEWLAGQLEVNDEAFKRGIIDQDAYLTNNKKFTSDEYVANIENMKEIGLSSTLIDAQKDINSKKNSLKSEDTRLNIEAGAEALLVSSTGASLIGMAYATFLKKKYARDNAKKERKANFIKNLYGSDNVPNEEEFALED